MLIAYCPSPSFSHRKPPDSDAVPAKYEVFLHIFRFWFCPSRFPHDIREWQLLHLTFEDDRGLWLFRLRRDRFPADIRSETCSEELVNDISGSNGLRLHCRNKSGEDGQYRCLLLFQFLGPEGNSRLESIYVVETRRQNHGRECRCWR